MSEAAIVSVVIPVMRDDLDLEASYRAYAASLKTVGRPLEFVYVVDGPLEHSLEQLKAMRRKGEPVEILHLAYPFGEATALMVGFRHARGTSVMTLPVEQQVDPAVLPSLIDELKTHDLVVTSRQTTPPVRLTRGKRLEYLVKLLLGSPYHDLRSGVRAMRRQVADELTLYGNQHCFLPLLAQTHGFTAKEVEVEGKILGRSGRGPDFRVLLDVLSIYFLIRFLKKPFRFFGGFGLTLLGLGGLITSWLVFARLFLGESLADRPSLILSTLMIVLGIQIIAVGLIGEIVTFTYTKDSKDYKVDRIVE